MATRTDEGRGYGRDDELLGAIEVDLNTFGVSFAEYAELDDLLTVVKSLMPKYEFHGSHREIDYLVGLMVKDVVAGIASSDYEPQSAEDEALGDNWNFYKYTAQTDGRYLERFEGLQGLVYQCVAYAENQLSQTERRILSIMMLGDPDIDDCGPFTISELLVELIVPRIAALAREEKFVFCDEDGKPLWKLLPDDESAVDAIHTFLLELVWPKQDPHVLCLLALAISFLRRLPRQTRTGFNLIFRHRADDELRYASICGDWSELTLNTGGSVDSGFGHDSYSNIEFQRFSSGRGCGSKLDVFEWINLARELLASGGYISTDGSAFDDIHWDDGESDIYWTMLGLNI